MKISLNAILPTFYNDMKSSTVMSLKLEEKYVKYTNQYFIPVYEIT